MVWHALDALITQALENEDRLHEQGHVKNPGIARLSGTRVQAPEDKMATFIKSAKFFDDETNMYETHGAKEVAKKDKGKARATADQISVEYDGSFDLLEIAEDYKPISHLLTWKSAFADSILISNTDTMVVIDKMITEAHDTRSLHVSINHEIGTIELRGHDLKQLTQFKNDLDSLEVSNRASKREVEHFVELEGLSDLLKFVPLHEAPLQIGKTTIVLEHNVTKQMVQSSWKLRLYSQDGDYLVFKDIAESKSVSAIKAPEGSRGFSPWKEFTYIPLEALQTSKTMAMHLLEADLERKSTTTQVNEWLSSANPRPLTSASSKVSIKTTAQRIDAQEAGPSLQNWKVLEPVKASQKSDQAPLAHSPVAHPFDSDPESNPTLNAAHIPLIPELVNFAVNTSRLTEAQYEDGNLLDLSPPLRAQEKGGQQTVQSSTLYDVAQPIPDSLKHDPLVEDILEQIQRDPEILSRVMRALMKQQKPSQWTDAISYWTEDVMRLEAACKNMFREALAFRGDISFEYCLGRILVMNRPGAGIDRPLSKPALLNTLNSTKSFLFTGTLTTWHGDADHILNLKAPGGQRFFNVEPILQQVLYSFVATKNGTTVKWDVDSETREFHIKDKFNNFGAAYCHFPRRSWDAVLQLNGQSWQDYDEDVQQFTATIDMRPRQGQPRFLAESPHEGFKVVNVQVKRITQHLLPTREFALQITEVQDLYIGVNPQHSTMFYAHAEGAARMASDHRLWFEFRLIPLRVKELFLQNTYLAAGTLPEWTPEGAFVLSKVVELHEVVRDIVRKLDSVGLGNGDSIGPVPTMARGVRDRSSVTNRFRNVPSQARPSQVSVPKAGYWHSGGKEEQANW
ncbi:MAG: hypothetical protein M1814_004462 [Vezdaea aestivalis]|nr:MAG: hypothetical protein M1814_004462 [Vezdaea aestivalis]